MLVHHIATIVLLTGCYLINLMEIGVLIALVHDLSDVPLEVGLSLEHVSYNCIPHTHTHTLQLAKLLNYAAYDTLAYVFFGVFSVVFAVTRLVIFPFWLIWSAIFDIPSIAGPYPAIYMYIGFLLVLQVC